MDLKHDGIVLDHLVDALAPQGILGGGFSRRFALCLPLSRCKGRTQIRGADFLRRLPRNVPTGNPRCESEVYAEISSILM